MGLFDWFNPSPPDRVVVLPDAIWLTRSAKLGGLARAACDALTGSEPADAVLLAAHFPDMLAELERLVAEGRVAGPVAVVGVEELRGRAAGMSLDESRTVLILVGERHPLRSYDDSVLEFARSLPCRCRIVFHVSLDEPLLRAFASESVVGLLRRFGMKEGEAIESPLVARRIKAAQEKFAKVCRGELPAESAEEWLRKNGPDR